jgi:20S proteasome alpha/beta subunit
MIASDNMCSYGKMARYKGLERMGKINDQCAMCSWGEYSDFTACRDKL